ncbi:MAG: transglutaminase domain-containing protein [Betaproteobacteria bacterium]|nr:transglutaminase domain-containing protein [Betaproteobacteria bacterium]
MNAPALMVGASLVFWGWQSGNLVVGIALGLALEAPRWLRLRLDLGTREHSTIADLCTVGFVLLALIVAANRGVARGILEAFIWLPVVLSPILAAQLVSAERRVPLSALFRHMRRLRRENPALKDPPVDVGPVYIALALVSAGVANQRGPGYYAGVVLAAGCMLYAVRPRHASLAAGAAMLAAAAALGYAGHVALAQAQMLLVDWVMDLDLIRTADPDPYRVRTEIGSLGRLKKYDAIVMRVYAQEKDIGRLRLLHRGSYNTFSGRSWLARGTTMAPVESEADNQTWVLAAAPPQWRVRIATRFNLGRTLLALPAGTSRIESFPANAMNRNALGAVHASLAVDWAQYEALGGSAIALYAPPSPEDGAVPEGERAVFERAAAELGLRAVAPAEALRRVERYFERFAYSIFRERPVPRGETALGDFMTRTRAGHCEYFAAAATLLLRAAGVPARYATGFAVVEYSAIERAYVVRTRHAHAWTRAFVDGRWVDLDTTPAAWVPEEAAEAPIWENLADLFRYAGFAWSQRGEFKAGNAWYAILVLLAAYLAWSVLRGRKLVREQHAAAAVRRRYPGEDSEFYALEKSLPQRELSETQSAWLFRVTKDLPQEKRETLRTALSLHQRYRFDPAGLAPPERGRLRELCRALAPQSQA